MNQKTRAATRRLHLQTLLAAHGRPMQSREIRAALREFYGDAPVGTNAYVNSTLKLLVDLKLIKAIRVGGRHWAAPTVPGRTAP